jgi:manganese transport protein
MQLPFAIFPLIAVTSDPKRMDEFANKPFVKVLGYTMGVVIAGLNVYLLYDAIGPVWLGLAIALVIGFAIYVRSYRQPAEA